MIMNKGLSSHKLAKRGSASLSVFTVFDLMKFEFAELVFFSF